MVHVSVRGYSVEASKLSLEERQHNYGEATTASRERISAKLASQLQRLTTKHGISESILAQARPGQRQATLRLSTRETAAVISQLQGGKLVPEKTIRQLSRGVHIIIGGKTEIQLSKSRISDTLVLLPHVIKSTRTSANAEHVMD
ncbi:hypothetical protein EVAR_62208_1 [Eumeta japonica]|uniref:Uncharacterized protein n=1 Tax=Eumeta variegata TaxID=151549 RepID=A0A4C2A0Y3_EUMVA|nr:hypothetical protein EVAR_62208_1 [Eumeta japonica]